MRTISEAITQEAVEELKICLDKCKHCDCVATLKKMMRSSSGDVRIIDLSQVVCEDVTAIFFIRDRDRRVRLELQSGDLVQLKQIRALYDTLDKSNTQAAFSDLGGDFILDIGLFKQELEHDTVYSMSFVQPDFMALEEETLSAAFPMLHISYGIETVTLSEVEYDEEYESRYYDGYDDGIGTYADNDDVDDNTPDTAGEIIGNDRYIGV